MVFMLSVSVLGIKKETEKKNPRQILSPNLKPIIGPGPKLHDAGLLIEGKIFDVNLARRFVDGGRFPLYQPVVPQGCLRC